MKKSNDGVSALVENMATEARDMEQFPVLIGDEVTYFHDVAGGYDRMADHHAVELIHRVQKVGRPNHIDPDQASHNFEAHLDNYYNMDVESVSINSDYPDNDYIMTVTVENYRSGPYSFSEALTADVDRRETRFEQ
jgi:hypothetical protein